MSLTDLQSNRDRSRLNVRARSNNWAIALVIAAFNGCGGGSVSGTTTITPTPSNPSPPPSASFDPCLTSPFSAFAYSAASISAELGDALDLSPQATLSAGCSAPSLYSLTGALPVGISFDASSGRISGIPASGGQSSITVSATGSSGPFASLTIAVSPLTGASTQALQANRIPSTLPALQGNQLAALDASTSPALMLMGKNLGTNQMEYWRSTNQGAAWVQLAAPNSPQSRGGSLSANQFRIAQGVGGIFVLDAGGSSKASYGSETGAALNGVYDIPARLYRFDGSNWSLANSSLPQVWNGAAFFSSGANLHIAFERPMQSAFEYSNDSGASFSTYSSLDTDPRNNLPANAAHCGGFANGLYFYQPGQAGNVVNRFLVRGDLQGAVPSTWENSLPTFSLAGFVSTTQACTAWNNQFWIASTPPGENYLTLLSATSASSVAYPRRYRSTPVLVNLAPAGNRLLGVSVDANGLAAQLWSLAP
jgi:Putative Ig domain